MSGVRVMDVEFHEAFADELREIKHHLLNRLESAAVSKSLTDSQRRGTELAAAQALAEVMKIPFPVDSF